MRDVLTWFERIGLAQYASLFANAGIDPRKHGMTSRELEDLGVHPSHIAAILNAARSLEDGKLFEERAHVETIDASGWSRDDADRRPLTVLFCDLVGSVQLSNAVDPEDFRVLLNLYRRTCGLPIARFGGYVARYIGDGILAYFGYPSAHEDDAERAIGAGLEILTLMSDFTPEPRHLGEAELAVRIGIATSSVVVGKTQGGAAAEEVEVTGEAPNLAAVTRFR
jgi:class 3 adenylate cyclase